MVFKSSLPCSLFIIYVHILFVKNVAVVSVSANNLCLPFDCTEIHKKNVSLFLNTISSISNSRLSSLGIFKHKL